MSPEEQRLLRSPAGAYALNLDQRPRIAAREPGRRRLLLRLTVLGSLVRQLGPGRRLYGLWWWVYHEIDGWTSGST